MSSNLKSSGRDKSSSKVSGNFGNSGGSSSKKHKSIRTPREIVKPDFARENDSDTETPKTPKSIKDKK